MKTEKENQPTIVKYVGANYGGIQLLSLSRYAIGYVVRGTKHIFYGDACHTILKGDVFYMGVGNHYVEDIPEESHPFEQIIVYYSPDLLQRILLYLNMTYSINITNTHHCEKCRKYNHVAVTAVPSIRNFFSHIASYLQDDNFMRDETAENIKMTELIYLIISQADGCLKSKMLANVDTARDNFEQVIYSHIFRDVSIEELSELCNRSLTSFKKEFKRHFFMPPHRWFIHQRLMQSRLLLISTSKSISEIGIECTFPNTSHFIKLFRKEYGTTPHYTAAVITAAEVSRDRRQRRRRQPRQLPSPRRCIRVMLRELLYNGYFSNILIYYNLNVLNMRKKLLYILYVMNFVLTL